VIGTLIFFIRKILMKKMIRKRVLHPSLRNLFQPSKTLIPFSLNIQPMSFIFLSNDVKGREGKRREGKGRERGRSEDRLRSKEGDDWLGWVSIKGNHQTNK